MRIELPQVALQTAMRGLSRILSPRSSLPVLNCLRLDVDSGVHLSATNLDQTATYTVEEATTETGKGSMLLPCEGLKSLLKGCRGGIVEIEGTGTDIQISATFAGQTIRRCFVAPALDEWPVLPKAASTEPVEENFLQNVRRALPFASTDSSRHVLESVYLDTSDPASHYIVATDGRRLTATNSVTFPFRKGVILPVTKFLAWDKLAGACRIGTDSKARTFTLVAGPWTYVTNTIEGTYPNWRQVVPTPTAGARTLHIADEDAVMLIRALPELAKASGPNRCVRLDLSARGSGIRTQTPDAGESIVVLPHSRYQGPEMAIGLNGSFLADALMAGFRFFDLTASDAPVVGHPSRKDRSATHVLMPLRIGDATPTPVTQTESEAPPAKAASEPSEQPTPTVESPMPRTKPTPQTSDPSDPFERLLNACDALKSALREANSALSELTGAAREAAREEKGRRKEVESVRNVLDKLQALKVA